MTQWVSTARIAAVLVAAVFGVLAAGVVISLLDLDPAERADLGALASPQRIGIVVTIALALLAALALIADRLAKSLAPVQRIAEGVRLMLGGNPGYRIDPAAAGKLQSIATAVNALAEERATLKLDVAATVAQASASVEAERRRFATLLAELEHAVVVCNADGTILLFNIRAVELVSDANGGETGLVGLGRSLFEILDREVMQHAVQSIARTRARGERGLAQIVTATPAGGMLRVQVAPVIGGDGPDAAVSGYVLLLMDVTATVESDAKRVESMQALTEHARAGLASMRAAIESIIDFPDMPAEQRTRFTTIVRDETITLTNRLDAATRELSDQLKSQWPLEEMRAEDLIRASRSRIEARTGLPTKTESIDATLWVRVDSFSVAQGLTYLAYRLKDEFDVREVRFAVTSADGFAQIDLIWRGAPLSPDTVYNWENDAFQQGGETSPLTLRQVIERHGAEAWYQRDRPGQSAYFRLMLPLAATPTPRLAGAIGPRPEFYDFDLFRASATNTSRDDQPLDSLAYTVFDTETTGLDPTHGDEIISIGALRIVNGRLLAGETFTQLVDPQRSMSAQSIAIHGIAPEQLVGQPTIDKVLPRFHRYALDTIMVAHNAAFDMRFLQLKEARTGVVFDHPVLDTLLLSAVVHPSETNHSLEAIASRFGVAVVDRHSALGDARVTAEIFSKMLPLLAAQGIRTLGEARTASERTFYARLKY